jgi:putative peptidoglycan lipid II flippase
MNLWKATGTIGGLTMVSRVLGFAREMIFARVLGAGLAADAFALAFLIPNLFRRLFGEGAFSQGFVPLFSQRMKENDEEARRFAEEVLAVFMPVLMIITVIFMIAMPAIMGVIAAGWVDQPDKFGLAVLLTRITMPYLIFICLVSLFSGVLNSLSRFTAAAFAPSLLNITLIAALLLVPEGGARTAQAMAWGVVAGGVLQLALCWASTHAAGVKLRLTRPRLTP